MKWSYVGLVCILVSAPVDASKRLPQQLGQYILGQVVSQPMDGTNPPRWTSCASCVKDEDLLPSVKGKPVDVLLNKLGLNEEVPDEFTRVYTYRGRIESFEITFPYKTVEKIIPLLVHNFGPPSGKKITPERGICYEVAEYHWTDGTTEIVLFGLRKHGNKDSEHSSMSIQHKSLAAQKAKETPYGPPCE